MLKTLPYFKKAFKKAISLFGKDLKNRINYKKGIELNVQQLVYYYNILLNREYLGKENEFSSQWESASKNFKGATKDFLHFILLKKFLNKNVVNYENYLFNYQRNSRNKEYIAYIDSIVAKNKHHFKNEEYNTILSDSLGNHHSLKAIIERHKNRLIYIDFWASWCAPCKREMLFYAPLEETLRDKNLSYIFISIDENETAWKSSLRKSNTQKYEHYILRKDTPLFNFFNLTSIPRYAIIDKNGRLVNYDASRPSEKEKLLEFFNKISSNNN